MNNIEALKVFVEVAKQGSFAEAARHLNQPTTTVSRKIKLLEEELGTLLIHRTTRTQSLTEAGDAVLTKAEAVLASLQELSDEVTQNAHSPKGALRISGPATVLKEFAPVFAAFSKEFPDISLRFESSSRYQNLIDDRLDFAFRVGPLTDSTVIARRITPMSNSLVASPSFLKGKTVPVHPSELSSWRCIRSHINGYETPWTFSHKDGDTLQVHPNGQLVSDDLTFCLKMAIEGLGLAYLSDDLIKPHIDNQSLSRVTINDWVPTTRDLYLVYQEKSYLPPKSRAFLDFFSDRKNYRLA